MKKNVKSEIKKRRWLGLDVLIVLLTAYCLLSTVTTAFINIYLFCFALIIDVILLTVLYFFIRRFRKMVASVLYGRSNDGSNTEYNLDALNMPVVILINKRVVWYNNCFREVLLGGSDTFLESVFKLFPSFEVEKCAGKEGQCFNIDGRSYTAFGSGVKNDENIMVLYMVDDTLLKQKAQMYDITRPAVLHILVDTYDEMKKELKESERSNLMGAIDLELEKYIGKTTGFLLRTAADKYVAVVEERHLQRFVEDKFEILDKVRSLGGEVGMTTLSIGVGRGGETFEECEIMATNALDMALGRGGDQVSVKTEDGYTFFGGVARGVEKRSKVKARIVANALEELIELSDSVVIMGHRFSDMDSVGASVGVLKMCMVKDKPACLAVSTKTSLASSLIERLAKFGFGEHIYSPEEILPTVTEKTLLIIVDTHVSGLLESKEIYEACKNIVVIDHHRKMVGHIDNAVIFYHEPYASSACELVSELLQYSLQKEEKLAPYEAEALLAGIMLDTREFSVHTGVRTFEAAAYLRRMGAQTVETKKLFASTILSYKHKSDIVTSAEIYAGCAIAMSDNLPSEMRVVIPQAANDLLAIQGVLASFVAVKVGESVSVSARSLGEINVQVIMEKLGGGGHLTMAGTQIDSTDMMEVKRRIIQAIDEYWQDNKKDENKG